MNLHRVTADEIETLRGIRNSCRSFMTNNQEYINEEEQSQWYRNLDTEVNRVLLVMIDSVPVGYAIIAIDGDRAWLTGGLLPEFRDRGLGRELFKDLSAVAINLGKTPCLSVLLNNHRAIRVYQKLGFVECSRDDRTAYMELP
jgi:ribosomal protein S18 acetylase RimI-like enzyme